MTRYRFTNYSSMRHLNRTSLFVAALTGVLCTPACDDNNTTVIAPTPPPSITETISGNLTPFSARIHFFQVQNPGPVTASLTALAEPDPDPDPDNLTRVGLDIGTGVGTACQVVVSRTDVFQTQGVAGSATAAGTLCVRIYDVGDTGLPAKVDYTITITHY